MIDPTEVTVVSGGDVTVEVGGDTITVAPDTPETITLSTSTPTEGGGFTESEIRAFAQDVLDDETDLIRPGTGAGGVLSGTYASPGFAVNMATQAELDTVAGTVTTETARAQAAEAQLQPLDSDLTAIAALTTTSFGRALLALADAAAGRTALGLGTAATSASTAFAASTHASTHGSAGSDPLTAALLAPILWPDFLSIDTYVNPSNHSNWSSFFYNSGALTGAYLHTDVTTVGSWIEWSGLQIKAGTWEMLLIHRVSADAGIITPTLGGVTGTTIDTYASGNANNVRSTSTFVVSSASLATLRLTMATKNASSSAFAGRIQAIGLRRTA